MTGGFLIGRERNVKGHEKAFSKSAFFLVECSNIYQQITFLQMLANDAVYIVFRTKYLNFSVVKATIREKYVKNS